LLFPEPFFFSRSFLFSADPDTAEEGDSADTDEDDDDDEDEDEDEDEEEEDGVLFTIAAVFCFLLGGDDTDSAFSSSLVSPSDYVE
jgi:hypothetical protein